MRAQQSRLARVIAAAGLVLAIGVTGLPAVADPNDDDPAVAEARRQEQIAEASVAELEAMLDDLRAQTESAQATAALAAEAYNAAAEELTAATEAADQANAAAIQAEQDLKSARSTLARVAVATSQSSTELGVLEPFLSSSGLDEALDRGAMLHVVGSSTRRASNQLAVAEQAAEQAQIRATDAAELQAALAAEAEGKAQAAADAAAAALAAEEAAEVEHQQLLEELAEKRQTTVEAEAAAEQRRIEEANRLAEQQRLEEQRRLLGQTTPTPTPTQEPTQQPTQTAEPTPTPTPSQPADNPGDAPSDTPSTEPTTDPAPDPDPTPPPSDGNVSSDAAAAAALEWARAQIGKPYQWGGNGPDSFDCSGLTSQAYLNATGKWIQRTAAAQYAAATKIPYDSMRPGDLIFWDQGSGVYHVALYAGNGMMVEAPHTGAYVREVSVRWANTTTWAGRV
ncbi:MAG: C40 family peptidase [Bifidobacteriaceae bacterium]|jgi:cell wall-associated NlpC family hydrolase|nr:C40 family peptidase [Bifidobacteriaceae bacterium]